MIGEKFDMYDSQTHMRILRKCIHTTNNTTLSKAVAKVLQDGDDVWLETNDHEVLIRHVIRPFGSPHVLSGNYGVFDADGCTTGLSICAGITDNGMADWICLPEVAFFPLFVEVEEEDLDQFKEEGASNMIDVDRILSFLTDKPEMCVEFVMRLRTLKHGGSYTFECVHGRDFKPGEYTEDATIPLRYNPDIHQTVGIERLVYGFRSDSDMDEDEL